jgi:hypothetical protein
MRRMILLTVVLFFLMTLLSQAAPFLVCDPYPTTGWQPTSFLITIDGGAIITSPAFKNPNNSVQLKYDLSAVSVGAHNVTVRSADVWGSSVAVPFTFTRPATTPAVPSNINISAQ